MPRPTPTRIRELDFTTPLELLVATILSAQCTDARVNLVTPKAFATYRSAADYAAADRAELEQLIQSTGFFRAKTNALIGLGQALVERYHGEVPARLKDLVTLPGVGRKTANVVLGNAFGKPGITGRHPLRAAGAPLRLDRRDRSREGRGRGRRTVPAQRMDDAQPPVDLARPAGLPLASSRVRCVSVAALCPSFGEGEIDAAKAAKLVKTPNQDA